MRKRTSDENTYNYIYVDGSWLLTRNLFMSAKEEDFAERGVGKILELTIQTIRKYARDFGIHGDKVIIVYDKYDPNIGGYFRSNMLKDHVAYKGSREYMCVETYEQMKLDPNVTEEQLREAAWKLQLNLTKQEAKRIMLEEFYKVGLYTYCKPGLEFDDIMTIASFMRSGDENDNGKKDLIITSDSDLEYSLGPHTDLFHPRHGAVAERIVTYEEMCDKIPEGVKERGVPLYMYKALLDTLGGGHNDLRPTKRPKTNTDKVVLEVLDGNFDNVMDRELFDLEMKTFDLSNFQEAVDEVRNDIKTLFPQRGRLGGLDEFRDFCIKHKIYRISDRYYSDFISEFNQKLFCDGNN